MWDSDNFERPMGVHGLWQPGVIHIQRIQLGKCFKHYQSGYMLTWLKNAYFFAKFKSMQNVLIHCSVQTFSSRIKYEYKEKASAGTAFATNISIHNLFYTLFCKLFIIFVWSKARMSKCFRMRSPQSFFVLKVKHEVLGEFKTQIDVIYITI